MTTLSAQPGPPTTRRASRDRWTAIESPRENRDRPERFQRDAWPARPAAEFLDRLGMPPTVGCPIAWARDRMEAMAAEGLEVDPYLYRHDTIPGIISRRMREKALATLARKAAEEAEGEVMVGG